MSDQGKPVPVRTDQDAHDKMQVKIVDMLDPTLSAEVTTTRELRTTNTAADVGAIVALIANSNFMKLSNFDKIVPVFALPLTTYEYYESGALIGEARLRFVSSADWDLELEAFLNDDDGTMLLNDDDVRLTLE